MTIIYLVTNRFLYVKDILESTISEFKFRCFNDYRLFLDACRNNTPRLIILDYDIANIDAFQLLTYTKRNVCLSYIPVIMIGNESNKLYEKALELGATDYLSNNHDFIRFPYKVRSLLKNATSNYQKCKDLYLDINDLAVYVRNERIPLTYKEYRLLSYLMSKHNKLITKKEISYHFWYGVNGTSRTLDMHISSLRKKVFSKSELNLITIIKFGYRLI